MGERLAGKYDVVDHLATGGMAEVYLARVRGPGDFERRLVIKRVLPSLAAEQEFTRLFEAEARYAALIEHPHVAQVYDFGRDEQGLPFLAMEYVDGASLRELFKAAAARDERSDPRLVAWVFARVAEGLAAAHALVDPRTRQPLHLVHRDVSPDNVLVSRLGAVKVADFGIARAMVKAGTTRPDQMRGKLRYLSPEQILGEAPTLAVDVWAMGVCLYEALAGQRPFPEANEGQLVDAIARGLRPPLDALRPDVPRALVAVVDRCLEVDVARRMPDCQELALALHRAVSTSGPPITTAMVGGWVDRLVPPREDGRASRWLPELFTSAGAERSPGARRAAAMSGPGAPALDEDDVRPTPVAPTALADGATDPRREGGDWIAWRGASSAREAADRSRDAESDVAARAPQSASRLPAAAGDDARAREFALRSTGHAAAGADDGAVRYGGDARDVGTGPDDWAGPPEAPGSEVERPARRRLGVVALALLAATGVGALAFLASRPPAPEPARVVVNSVPPGATVRVAGRVVGQTPWAGDQPGAAPFEVEVSAPGYEAWTTTLQPGAPASVEAKLKKRR